MTKPTVYIAVGSESGTAQKLADSLTQLLKLMRFKVVPLTGNFESIDAKREDVLLVCTSTCGAGDLPDNIRPLCRHLLNPSTIFAVNRYGLICLGDSSFSTFAGAGETMEHALEKAGLTRIGDQLIIDGMSELSPLDQAKPWFSKWVTQL